jgi:BirA family transcriptional regulator, biotin operon repressor / biotin---[acetyl-CoA-carboxylase] ligase
LYKILANTLFFGKNLVFVPECHSTNTLLVDLAQKTNQPEGTLVITHEQTRGKGQRGNGWEAEAGKNLTLSLLLKPSFLFVKDQFYLTIATSVGVHDFLVERLGGEMEIKIKWPNDVMVGDKKIAGILIENSLAGEQLQQSVVGIGLNVNQQLFSIATATSMVLESKNEFDLSMELSFLMEKLEKRYLQLRAGKRSELKEAYLKNLYRIGEESTFVANGKNLIGKIEGVDESGKLKVNSNGVVYYFGLKEISFAV